MKLSQLILFFFAFCITSSLYSQFYPDSIYSNRIEAKRNILKTNPFTIAQGPIPFTSEFRLAYEHVTSERTSLQISASYLAKGFYLILAEAANNPPVNFKVRGYRLQGEYKYYLIKRNDGIVAPRGIYLAPMISYSHVKISEKSNLLQDEYLSITFMNYSLKFGIQILKKNLAFDPFIGFGYKDNVFQEHYNNATTTINTKELDYFTKNHFKFLLGFNAGWAF